MKKARKGFTLVELLIVIGIIGTLSAMMMVSSSEAQNAARATKIIEGFRSISAAMMMYYNEDTTVADKADAEAIITGAKRYLKNEAVFDSAAKTTAGTYYVEVNGDTWWLSYRMNGQDGALNELLTKKAKELDLKSAADPKPKEANEYDGEQDIFMNVR